MKFQYQGHSSLRHLTLLLAVFIIFVQKSHKNLSINSVESRWTATGTTSVVGSAADSLVGDAGPESSLVRLVVDYLASTVRKQDAVGAPGDASVVRLLVAEVVPELVAHLVVKVVRLRWVLGLKKRFLLLIVISQDYKCQVCRFLR